MKKEKKLFPCEVALLIALIINSINICFLVKSSFGISTLSSVPLVLSSVLKGLSFGTWTFIVQVITMIILVSFTKQFKIEYIVSFAVASFFSIFVDIFSFVIIQLPNLFWWRIVYFLIGFFGLGFGAALFIKSKLPAMPFDLFVRELSETKKWSIQTIKIIYDLVSVGISIIISTLFLHRIVGVGIGTVISAFTMGFVIQFFIRVLEKYYIFKPYFKATEKMIDQTSEKGRFYRSFQKFFHK